MENVRRILVFLLMLLIVIGSVVPVGAVSEGVLKSALEDTAAYMYNTVKRPDVGSVGGEWAVLGLARSGYPVPERYYQDYYARVEQYVKELGGVLHDKKYTEYSRLTVALTSIGRDPRNVAGYNLLTPLGDFDKTIWQGINGPIWALIALDSGGYPMPQNPDAATQATRDMYIDEILSRQLEDGGFSLFGGTGYALLPGDMVSDPDISGMALQALAKYQYREDVKKVTQEALATLSQLQRGDGGFASWGTTNSESCVQVIVALVELGIPLDDPRFVKNGNTLLDNLLNFYMPGKGFLHTIEGSGSNQMAAEQGFYGLVAAQRALTNQNSLYRMDDAITISDRVEEGPKASAGISGKHADAQVRPLTSPGRTFSDIQGHKNQEAIETLAARQIVAGKSEDLFEPDSPLTRAEVAAIVVKALGLKEKGAGNFDDVQPDSWYAGVVDTAYGYGLVSGTSTTAKTFHPQNMITREQAAAIVTKAAGLVGMDTSVNQHAVRDILAQFVDYVTVSNWAQSSLAFCYSNDIISQSDLDIRPQEPIQRGEMVEMLFHMLKAANLL